jgi:hypothetical protein
MALLTLLSVVLLLFVFFIIVKTKPQGRHISISEHAATRTWSYILFGTALTTCGSMIILFAYKSLGPQLGMTVVYKVVLALGWLALLMTAWIPDPGKGRLSDIHKIIAFSLAGTMAGLMACLTFAIHTPILLRLVSACLAVFYAYTIFLFYNDKSKRKHFLVYQIFNIVSFFTVFTLAYILSM